MAIVTQTRTAGTIATGSGTFIWSNPGNARTLDGSFAQTISSGSGNIEPFTWDDFGFTFDTSGTLQGIQITRGFVQSFNSAVSNYSLTIRNAANQVLSTNITAPPLQTSGARSDASFGGSSDDLGVGSDGDYADISTINDAGFQVLQTGVVVSGGTPVWRHYGLEMQIWVDVPDPPVVGPDNPGLAIVGNLRARTQIIAANNANYMVLAPSTALTQKSNIKFVLGGMPISMYEDGEGTLGFAVYDASGSFGGALTASETTYVYRGTKYALLESSEYRVFRAFLMDEAAVTASNTVVWQGSPVSLSSDGDIIVKKITGTVDEIRRFSLGGMPLAIVRIGTDWALVVSNI